jgi:hypothetical protein
MARSRLLTAAKLVLYVNGKPYSLATHLRWDSGTPKKSIYALDSGEPYELAPTTTKVSGSIGLLRLIGDGGLEGAGITPNFESLVREKYFTMALIERSTNTEIFRANRCSVVNQSWDVPSKSIVTGTFVFEALDWNNESASR